MRIAWAMAWCGSAQKWKSMFSSLASPRRTASPIMAWSSTSNTMAAFSSVLMSSICKSFICNHLNYCLQASTARGYVIILQIPPAVGAQFCPVGEFQQQHQSPPPLWACHTPPSSAGPGRWSDIPVHA